MRRLPGPASSPLCEGGQPPEAHHELFRDWQRTNSIFCEGSSEPDAANGCMVLQVSRNHGREAQLRNGTS